MISHPALRSVGKGLAVAAAVAGGFFLLFVAALNLFIGTRLFRHAISYDPGSLLVDYDRAYSLWPGRIHVEGLVIRGRDSNVEWSLVLGRCDFQEHFLDLFHRQFHAGPVTCDGLNLRLRQRQPTWTAAALAATPPIPGFSDPALPEPGPPPPPLTDANYHLWSIRLDDVVARNVREIWIDTLRASGEAEVHGRWLFRPMRWLEVGPATVDLRSLEVGDGTVAALATGLRGHLDATLHPVSLRDLPLSDLLQHISVAGDLAGEARTANLLRVLAPGARAEATDADVSVHVAINHGTLNPGSEASAGPCRLHVIDDSLSVESTLRVHAAVDTHERMHADVVARELVAKLGAHALRGNMNVALHAHREGVWTDLAGSGFSFVGAVQTDARDDTPPDWWLRGELRRGLFDAKGGLHLRADVAVQAKDASPITAAIVSQTPLPSWLVDAVSTRGFETNGQLLVSPAVFEARDVDARAQGVDARFAFLRRSRRTEWALYVDLGALKAGVDSQDGKAGVVLLDARSWFEARAATMRASGVHE
jgi:hypothetical protein